MSSNGRTNKSKRSSGKPSPARSGASNRPTPKSSSQTALKPEPQSSKRQDMPRKDVSLKDVREAAAHRPKAPASSNRASSNQASASQNRGARGNPEERVAAADAAMSQFTLKMRTPLHKELARMALDNDMTMRGFIMQALKREGLSVTDTDLVDGRKR